MENNVTDVRIVDDKRSGLATASMILGIVAIIGAWIPFLNIFSIIMGFIGLGLGIPAFIIFITKKRGSLGKIIAGLVLCVVTLIIAFSINSAAVDNINEIFGTDKDSKLEYSYGETAELEGVSIKVLGVERSDGYTESYLTISPNKKDYEFIIVELEIKNNSEEIKTFNRFDYSIQTGNGVINRVGFSMYDTGNDLGSGQLAPNGIKIGKIVFEVPKDDDNLTLIYKDSLFSNKEIKLKLQ